MIRKIADFLKEWQYESDATARMFSQLTDASLSQRVAEGHRTLGYLAWHITLTIPEMMTSAGLKIDGAPESNSAAPASASEILETYKKMAAEIAKAVETSWTDAQLEDELNMYGEQWKKGFILGVLVKHQIHHRGQMTVLMRQAGLKVPGIYGPAQEEWAAIGMTAQP